MRLACDLPFVPLGSESSLLLGLFSAVYRNLTVRDSICRARFWVRSLLTECAHQIISKYQLIAIYFNMIFISFPAGLLPQIERKSMPLSLSVWWTHINRRRWCLAALFAASRKPFNITIRQMAFSYFRSVDRIMQFVTVSYLLLSSRRYLIDSV